MNNFQSESACFCFRMNSQPLTSTNEMSCKVSAGCVQQVHKGSVLR